MQQPVCSSESWRHVPQERRAQAPSPLSSMARPSVFGRQMGGWMGRGPGWLARKEGGWARAGQGRAGQGRQAMPARRRCHAKSPRRSPRRCCCCPHLPGPARPGGNMHGSSSVPVLSGDQQQPCAFVPLGGEPRSGSGGATHQKGRSEARSRPMRAPRFVHANGELMGNEMKS